MNYLLLEENTISTSWPLLLILGVFLVLMIVMSIVPQRKRQKQMAEMMNSMKVGDEIRTVGGLAGFITAIDETGLLTINVGTEESPTYIKLMREGIYQVIKKEEPAAEVAPAAEESENKDDANADLK
ncbi:MAG: preprotein translocase subunit YajC [Christensenellales bacterium]